MKLLIIEDDAELNQSICAFLLAQHYHCETATTYRAAQEKIEVYDYDCIILDLTLPGGDGLGLLQQLKDDRKSDGVIIISARAALDDKLLGMNLGADDYLTKPFHLAELSARITAIIRRKNLHGSNMLSCGDIQIDLAGQCALVKEIMLPLTRKEYELLQFFIINANRVLSKNTIAAHLWGDDMDIVDSFDFIYTHIKNLRKKLETAGAVSTIQSIYGMGYKFSAG